MTLSEANHQLITALSPYYEQGEINAIASLVMEKITGWGKMNRILRKQEPLSEKDSRLLMKYIEELSLQKPVQYVLGEAWFYGLKFAVNEHVLIPRPETEELVEWIIKDLTPSHPPPGRDISTHSPLTRNPSAPFIMDVGTGSGCISISLKKKIPGASVYAVDVSGAALQVAAKNAESHQTEIQFLSLDFLDPVQWKPLPKIDILVSNPPYIPNSDKTAMRPNVLDFEPHLALFVENTNPLLFYESIALFAKEKLEKGGRVYVEIHENMASHVKKLFSSHGFLVVDIKNDLAGKERMIKATMLL